MLGTDGKYIFGTAKVGERGQIVIPKEAREVMGIHPGDTLLILGDEKQGLAIVNLNSEALARLTERAAEIKEENDLTV